MYILPISSRIAIYRQWQHTNQSGCQNANNMALVNNVTIKMYRCPSSPLPDFYISSNNAGSIQMMTSYTGIAGSSTDAAINNGTNNGSYGISSGGGVLFANSAVSIPQIIDGTSNQMLVGEQSDHLRDAANVPIPGSYTAITSQGPHGWTMGTGYSTSPPPRLARG